MHGDLAPWNLRRLRDGRLVLFDWENVRWAPPTTDEVFYRAASGALGRGSSGQVEVREAVEFWRETLRERPVETEQARRLVSAMRAILERA